jgi:Response regulator receiver domain.
MHNQLILIIDDNGTNLKVLSQTLTSAGFQLAVATNGEEAPIRWNHKTLNS